MKPGEEESVRRFLGERFTSRSEMDELLTMRSARPRVLRMNAERRLSELEEKARAEIAAWLEEASTEDVFAAISPARQSRC